MSTQIPKHVQVLVVGGGPAGSYTASALAREGFHVVLLESVQFPRYHIGESLIPSVRYFLQFIGAEVKLVDHGFTHKPGAAFLLDHSKREGYTNFIMAGATNNAWNVTRADFDQMLLDHARESGVYVYENIRVESLQFSALDPFKPVAASWTSTSTSHQTGVISFEFLVDATGRAGLVSTKYLHNRHYNEALKNIAVWGYWEGGGTYGIGTVREGAPWFEALEDKSGWAWYIPLHDGTTSVGVVVNQELYNARGKITPKLSTEGLYRAYISLAPGLCNLLGDGVLVAKPSSGHRPSSLDPLVRSASDFSYSAKEYAGPAFRIVGDAAAFIDPFFSSGVHLAMTSALSAAASICASIRGDCSESAAATWHTKRVSLSYTRFQMAVLGAYEHIRGTRLVVLDDVNERDFDKIFAVLRPLIQGSSDMGVRQFEGEVGKALDLCSKILSPVTPEQAARAVQRGLPSEVLDASVPLVDPETMANMLESVRGSKSATEMYEAEGDEETKSVAESANARRLIRGELVANCLEVEDIDGYVVRLQQGCLGLRKGGE